MINPCVAVATRSDTQLFQMILREVCTKGRRGHELEEGRKEAVRAPSTKRTLGTWRVWGVRGDTAAPLAKGFIYVLRPPILIKSLWVLYHHGGGRVESFVKKC